MGDIAGDGETAGEFVDTRSFGIFGAEDGEGGGHAVKYTPFDGATGCRPIAGVITDLDAVPINTPYWWRINVGGGDVAGRGRDGGNGCPIGEFESCRYRPRHIKRRCGTSATTVEIEVAPR